MMADKEEDEINDYEDESDNGKTNEGNAKTILPEPLTKLSPPLNNYFLDQMKNGMIISNKAIDKNRLIFGRARDCDIIMDHPSISRYHAAMLWAPKNDGDYVNGSNKESFWYLIDCGSTHGTLCNKQKVETGKLIKIIPNNNLFRFGASTRLFTLVSKEEESDDDSDDDEQYQRNLQERKRQRGNDEEESEDACTWGMSMVDSTDETEESEDSIALKSIIAAMKDGQSSLQSENENAFADNPYKCLQQWFEREGYEFDYKPEAVNNKYKCIIELPIDGQWIQVEGQLTSKKKEAITDACLKCCKLLDQAKLLFAWQNKDSARTKAQKEFYDDDDDLIDETVKVNKKFKKNERTVDTYESLLEKWKELNSELRTSKVKLATIGLEPDVQPEIPENMTDSLDLFYATLNQKKYGLSMNEKIEKSNLRIKIKQLEQEMERIEKLIQIAKPVQIVLKNNKPQLPSTTTTNPTIKVDKPMAMEPNIFGEEDNYKSSNKNIIPTLNESTIPEQDNSIVNKTETEVTDKFSMKSSNSKNYREIRKYRQESIVQAIEKEKLLEEKKQKEQSKFVDDNDPDFIDWIPPDNQSGDGKTHLNDKFGY